MKNNKEEKEEITTRSINFIGECNGYDECALVRAVETYKNGIHVNNGFGFGGLSRSSIPIAKGGQRFG